MFDNLTRIVNDLLDTTIHNYTDIEAPFYDAKGENTSFITKDGGFRTMLSLKGSTLFIGSSRFEELLTTLNDALEKSLQVCGHKIEFVYIRNKSRNKAFLDDNMKPIFETMNRFKLDLGFLLNERVKVGTNHFTTENVYLAITTKPVRLRGLRAKQANLNRAKLAKATGLKPGLFAQSQLVAFSDLYGIHKSFTDGLISTLEKRLLVAPLQHVPALRLLRKEIQMHSTSSEWTPILPGDRYRPKLVQETPYEGDISHLLTPDLCSQLFSSVPEIYDQDRSVVHHDGRYIAPLLIESAQKKPNGLNELLEIVPEDIPIRINFTLDTGHTEIVGRLARRKTAASFLAWSNSANTLIRDACVELLDASKSETIVTCRTTVVTWHDDYAQLRLNKDHLIQCLQNWSSLDVVEEDGDPIRPWLDSLPGLTGDKLAVPIAMTLSEFLTMQPIGRIASPHQWGTLMMNTPDHVPYKMDFVTDQQPFTAQISFAGPGSGKSLKLLAENLALLIKPGNINIPKIKMIDIGFTAPCFVDLVQQAWPQSMRYMAQSITLENDDRHAINFLYTPLGCRFPMAVQRTDQASMLEQILTPANSQGGIPRLSELCSSLIDELYKQYSDTVGDPKVYVQGRLAEIDNALQANDFVCDEGMSWWEIVDYFALELKDTNLAAKAQRYAMPLLSNIAKVLNSYAITSVYKDALLPGGENLLTFASQMVISALSEYPLLTQPTQIDTSTARILAIDLQNVAPKGEGKNAKQTNIMYLLARALCMTDFYYRDTTLEELANLNPAYADYYEELIRREASTIKKISYDEFHRTNGHLIPRALIEGDIREGRKYGISVSLISQAAEDFSENMIRFATDIYIQSIPLAAKAKQDIIQQFNPSRDVWKHAMHYVRSPNKEGSSMIYIGKPKGAPRGIELVLMLKLGASEIWAYSTTPKDTAVRRAIVKRTSLSTALQMLSERFPNGSSVGELDDFAMKSASNSEYESGSEGEADINLVEEFAAKIVSEYQQAA